MVLEALEIAVCLAEETSCSMISLIFIVLRAPKKNGLVKLVESVAGTKVSKMEPSNRTKAGPIGLQARPDRSLMVCSMV